MRGMAHLWPRLDMALFSSRHYGPHAMNFNTKEIFLRDDFLRQRRHAVAGFTSGFVFFSVMYFEKIFRIIAQAR